MHLSLSPAALAKAKAFGVVAAAITAGGAGGMAALSHVAPSRSSAVAVSADTSVPAPGSTEGTDAGSSTAPADAPSTEPSHGAPTSAAVVPTSCPSDTTHGGYVRSFATASPTVGAEHGSDVSAAARSDCGEPAHPTHPTHPTSAPSHPAHPAKPRPTPTPHHSTSSSAGSSDSSTNERHDAPTPQQAATTADATADASVHHGSHGEAGSGGHDH